ncbi:hypothetical protein COBT_000168 [Conglomerata obtusa]
MNWFYTKQVNNHCESTSLWNSLPNYSVYGGQLVSQALHSAYTTVSPGMTVRSLHANFLSPANITHPIKYTTENIRDGKTIKVRHVRAYQNDILVYMMNVTFSRNDVVNYSYQKSFLTGDVEYIDYETYVKKNYTGEDLVLLNKTLDHLRIANESIRIKISNHKNKKRLVKFFIEEECNNKSDFSCYVALISDFFLLESGLYALNTNLFSDNLQFLTSVDHVVRFFDFDFRCEELIMETECIKIADDRVFCEGNIFNMKNDLVATVSQEGIIRLKENPKISILK